MKLIQTLAVIAVFFTSGCATTGSDVSVPLPGTEAAVVKIFVDPVTNQPRVSENTVKVRRGQRVVWAGPDDFEIEFRDGGPFSQNKYSTDNAVINLVVPVKPGQARASGSKDTRYKYDVIVNGKVLDPHLVVIEQ